MPYTPEDVDRMLAESQRAPFLEVLGILLRCRPSEEAILRAAERDPSRWGQTVTMFAKLAGYRDEITVRATLAQEIETMPDSELVARLSAILPELIAALGGRALPSDVASHISHYVKSNGA